MKFGQIIKISYKNLGSKRTRTLFTVFAIAIGISAVLVLLSIGYGLQRLVERQTVGLEALRIIDVDTENSEVIRLNSDSVEKLKEISGVEKVVPQINAAGKLYFNGSVIDVTIFVADQEYLNLSYQSTLWGDKTADLGQNQIWVNSVITGLLEIDDKDQILDKDVTVDIIFSKYISDDEEMGSLYNGIPQKIKGVVVDQKTGKRVPIVYIPLDYLPELSDKVTFSRVKVLISNPDNFNEIRTKIESYGFKTASAVDTVGEIAYVFSTFRIALFVIGFVGVTISLVGMFNTLTISLMDRMREIGIMKALGMKNNAVLILFLTESVWISLFGGVIGIILSFVLGFLIEFIFRIISTIDNRPIVDFYYTPWHLVFYTMIISIVIGVLTGLYPAYRARKTRAIDALRYA